MLHGLVIVLTVAPHVDGLIDGISQRLLVNHIFAHHVQTNTMSGSSANQLQPRGETNTVLIGHSLEGRLSLIVIHGQYTVEMIVGAATKEVIGSIGAKYLDTLLGQFVDGGDDGGLFLVAQYAVFTAAGIQGQYGNART